MEKQQAIELTRQMIQVAGTDRVRALFRKYNMNGVTPNVTGIITGINLYGQAFTNDFLAIARDGARAKAKADGMVGPPTYEEFTSEDPVDNGTNAWDWIQNFLGLTSSAADTYSKWSNALTGSATSTTTANGQPIIITTPGTDSNSNSNTTVIIIAVVVLVVIIGLIAFLSIRKK
ncbi:MAG: hypothetical protein LBD91_08435 [Prevotellaceae bacterium]|jgi:hypothetical protein|nr:hypothetical protein [Prevotellaceae bacterium]